MQHLSLPHPLPIRAADAEVKVVSGQAAAFVHLNGERPEAGRVWVLWAVAGTGNARASVPIIAGCVHTIGVDGVRVSCHPTNDRLTVDLKGDAKFAPPVLVEDRPRVD